MNLKRTLLVMLLTVIYIFGCIIPPAAMPVVQAAESVQVVTITGSVVNVRTGPGTDYQTIGTVVKGSTYTVLGSAKDDDGTVWYKISVGGKNGYVTSEYCSVSTITAQTPTSALPTTSSTTSATTSAAPEDGEPVIRITASVANVRQSASDSAKRIGTAVRGETFSPRGTVSDSSGKEWYKISINGKEGFVSSDYAVLTETIPAQNMTVTVTGAVVNVRTDAGASAEKLGTVRRGETFTVLDTRQDADGRAWYKINTGEVTGFVSSDHVTVKAGVTTTTKSTTTVVPTTTTTKAVGSGSSVRSVTTGTVTTESTALNVRSGPGTGYDRVGTINNGATVTILGSSGSWYKISYNCSAGYGYVSKDYVTNVKTETTLVTLAFGTDYYYVNVGQTVKMSASASGFTVTYSSENAEAAPINSSTGVVSGNIPGLYKITAASGNMRATAHVVVLAPPITGIQHMDISDEAVAFIAQWEGGGNYDPTLDAMIFTPYKDSAGFWTVGYGHAKTTTESKSWSYARIVAEFNADITELIGAEHIITDDKPYLTQDEALALLRADLHDNGYVSAVSKWAVRNGVKLSQQQFDSLVSFCFNLGTSYWSSDTKLFYLKSAILCQRVGDDADPDQIIEGFTLYIKAGGKNLKGLWWRRRNEAEMFIEGDYAVDRSNKFTLPDLDWGD